MCVCVCGKRYEKIYTSVKYGKEEKKNKERKKVTIRENRNSILHFLPTLDRGKKCL